VRKRYTDEEHAELVEMVKSGSSPRPLRQLERSPARLVTASSSIIWALPGRCTTTPRRHPGTCTLDPERRKRSPGRERPAARSHRRRWQFTCTHTCLVSCVNLAQQRER